MFNLPFKSQIHNQFNRFILENAILGTFPEPKTLKSGRISHWYVNWRNAATDARLMDELADHVVAFVRSMEYTHAGSCSKYLYLRRA